MIASIQEERIWVTYQSIHYSQPFALFPTHFHYNKFWEQAPPEDSGWFMFVGNLQEEG